MSLTLAAWLDYLARRLAADFDAFDVFAFEGTDAELRLDMAAWRPPAGAALHNLDVAQATHPAANVADGRSLVEEALRQLSGVPGRMLLSVAGVHLLAALFPAGVLQPLNQILRRGNRVVVLVVPPAPPVALPDSVRLLDWRAALKASHSDVGPDRIIVRGGA